MPELTLSWQFSVKNLDVLNINPSHVESLFYLGALQVNHGQTDLGFELLERALKLARIIMTHG